MRIDAFGSRVVKKMVGLAEPPPLVVACDSILAGFVCKVVPEDTPF